MSKLVNYVDIILGGTPATNRPDFWDGEIPWVSIVDFTDAKKIYTTEKTITESGLRQSNTKLLDEGDIIVSARGTVGKVVICGKKMAFNQSCYALSTKDNNKLSQNYLFYLLQEKIKYLKQMAVGGVFNTIIKSTLEKVPVELPDISIQGKIADILSAYDDLINVNRRRIQLLEEAARLLFREWFVYFRFPGYEKVKIVDGVPGGWKKTTLGNVANRIKKNYSINDEDLNLVDLARINSRTLAVTDVGVASDLETARIIFEKDDILFSSIRPYLHKVVLAPFRGITNTSIFVIRAKNPIYRAYITLLLFSNYAIQFANQHSTGTKMPVVKWGSVSKLPALIPHQTIMEDFQNMVWPILEQIQLAYFQNQKLAQARNLLLPRLMSGEIGV